MQNTLKRMKEEKVHVAALITGGFHSEGIAKLMDEEKLSYLVVMPKFDDKSPNRPYIAILTQKPREYEEQFKDSDFYLATPEFFRAGLSIKDQVGVVAGLLAAARLANYGNLTPGMMKEYADAYGVRLSERSRLLSNLITPQELAARLAQAHVQPVDQGRMIRVSLPPDTFDVVVEGSQIKEIRSAGARLPIDLEPINKAVSTKTVAGSSGARLATPSLFERNVRDKHAELQIFFDTAHDLIIRDLFERSKQTKLFLETRLFQRAVELYYMRGYILSESPTNAILLDHLGDLEKSSSSTVRQAADVVYKLSNRFLSDRTVLRFIGEKIKISVDKSEQLDNLMEYFVEASEMLDRHHMRSGRFFYQDLSERYSENPETLRMLIQEMLKRQRAEGVEFTPSREGIQGSRAS